MDENNQVSMMWIFNEIFHWLISNFVPSLLYTTQTTKKKHWTHSNGLKQFFIMWVKMSVMTCLKFNIISTYFPMVSEWLCLCFRLFFRMEPCYLLMVNQDPVLFSLTQRMKFFRAVLVVIKIDLTKLFYAIISVVYYQWQKT